MSPGSTQSQATSPSPGDVSSPAIALLPGMTLNGTLFPPSITRTALDIEFCELVLSPTGALPPHEAGPMGPYLDRLETALAEWPLWQRSPSRIAIGHSFGGMLLLAWLARHPRLAPTGVVLIATTAGPMYRAASLRIGRVGATRLRLPLGPLVRWWNAPWVTRAMKRLTSQGRLEAVRQDFGTLSGARASDAAVDRMGWKNTDWRAMRSFRLAMRGFDVRPHLPYIPTPAVVLHGDRDSLIAPRHGERLARGLPGARFELVLGAAHALPLTHPERVEQAVRSLAT